MRICKSTGRIVPQTAKLCPHCGQPSCLTENHKVVRRDQEGTTPDPRPSLSERYSTGFVALDEILGGGFNPEKVIVLAARPGTGKTTLLLQIGDILSSRGSKTLFFSGEMGPALIHEFLDRYSLSETTMDIVYEMPLPQLITKVRNHGVRVLIIDSLQSLYTGVLHRASHYEMHDNVQTVIAMAREYGICVLAIAQVNKDGSMNGTNGVIHDVDVLLRMDNGANDEVIISATKNRLSSDSNARAIFRKTPRGLVMVDERETGYLLRHQQQKIPLVAFPFKGKEGISVEELSFVPNYDNNPRLIIEKYSSSSTKYLDYLIQGFFPGINTNFLVRANTPKNIDRAAELAIIVGLYALRAGKMLPADIAFCGAIDASGRILPIDEMQSRTRRTYAQGYSRLYGPMPIGGEQATWLTFSTVQDVLDALKL